MEKKYNIKTALIFVIFLFIVSSSHAITKQDIIKVSSITDTDLSCVYFASETKLGKANANGNYSYLNIDKKLNAYKKKRDRNQSLYLSAQNSTLKKSYQAKYKKFKKIYKQINQCKKYNTATIACEIYEANGINQKVINGAKCQSPSKSIVAKILIDTANNEGICSGTLIAPNAFLSAAHCFDDDDKIKKVKVVFGGKTYDASEWFINPAYTGQDEKGDISIIYISKNLSTVPFKLVSKQYSPNINEVATVIGYGISSFKPYVVGFYGGFLTISKVTSSGISVVYNKRFGGSNTCNGDSGGPLAVYEKGSWRLYGITSYGDDDNCGFYSGTENSWWSRINSNENIAFLESHFSNIFD